MLQHGYPLQDLVAYETDTNPVLSGEVFGAVRQSIGVTRRHRLSLWRLKEPRREAS